MNTGPYLCGFWGPKDPQFQRSSKPLPSPTHFCPHKTVKINWFSTARRKASFAIAVYRVCYGKSVGPSVCSSVTLQYCVKTRERRRMQLLFTIWVARCLVI